MHQIRKILTILFIVPAFLVISSSHIEAKIVSKLVSVTPADGLIEISEVGNSEGEVLIGEEFSIDSSISTGTNTLASFELYDSDGFSAELNVQEMSTLNIDRILNEETGLDKVQIRLHSGGFRLNEKSTTSSTTSLEVITPTGMLTLSDADLFVWIDFVSLVTSTEVYKGTVNTIGDQGGSAILTAGMKNTIDEFGSITEPENFVVIGESVLGESSTDNVQNRNIPFFVASLLVISLVVTVWMPKILPSIKRN